MPKTIYLIIDESGAKGYADNTECFPGEFGVMAGFPIPEHLLEKVADDLEAIRGTYFSEGKLHITDLAPEQQTTLRADMFAYFKGNQVNWLHEAIYVQGFYDVNEWQRQWAKEIKEGRKSKIRLSDNEKKEMLHAELFLGVFAKGVEFARELAGEEVHINVITDRIDEKIIKLFEGKARDYINVGSLTLKLCKGYDPNSKRLIEGRVEIEILGSNVLGDYSRISFSISTEDSALTFAADILVNSLNHHLKSRQEKNLGLELNSREALEGYDLADLAYCYSTQSQSYFTDTFYSRK